MKNNAIDLIAQDYIKIIEEKLDLTDKTNKELLDTIWLLEQDILLYKEKIDNLEKKYKRVILELEDLKTVNLKFK